jgi:methylated-DNA-[protein]-cysteine S-methyltransferase
VSRARFIGEGPLLYAELTTPVGPLWIAADRAELKCIAFRRKTGLSPPAHWVRWKEAARELGHGGAPGSPDQGALLLRETIRQLDEYFAGQRRTFDLALAPDGTTFQQRVWEALQDIPYGETISYGELARRIGLATGAARAVGLANGSNPIPIVIPCHRVIGSNGTLTGYGGGLPIKQALLSLERGERRLRLD